ncbi:hypothetical protein GURKE_00240 [Brevundimonas phage vB_BpoS-Gurke]|uniref:Uncharacterized protein n=1 Tax=Brevundimonas phage vB_BpoS-Gurke TaxID=2948599 RepID=A0A9E7SRU1_9CAUD|nr:hypothetical protein GURKE_00240 [Brevundimonas phage vB_BpoS-Gurke]
MDTNNFFDDTTHEGALLMEEYFVEQAARRRRLGYITADYERSELKRLHAMILAAFPEEADAPRYVARELTRVEAQIERIGAAVWEMFHARHGGEFDPSSDSMANAMTMQAADRAWAIAQEPEAPSQALLVQLHSDINTRMVSNDWPFLDEVCATRDPVRMSGSETMTYLRALYVVRDRLPAYGDFLARSKAAFKRRGRPDSVFRGLGE